MIICVRSGSSLFPIIRVSSGDSHLMIVVVEVGVSSIGGAPFDAPSLSGMVDIAICGGLSEDAK